MIEIIIEGDRVRILTRPDKVEVDGAVPLRAALHEFGAYEVEGIKETIEPEFLNEVERVVLESGTASSNQIVGMVRKRKQVVLAALRTLERQGRIRVTNDKRDTDSYDWQAA